MTSTFNIFRNAHTGPFGAGVRVLAEVRIVMTGDQVCTGSMTLRVRTSAPVAYDNFNALTSRGAG
jgi:hypothetical protein